MPSGRRLSRPFSGIAQRTILKSRFKDKSVKFGDQLAEWRVGISSVASEGVIRVFIVVTFVTKSLNLLDLVSCPIPDPFFREMIGNEGMHNATFREVTAEISSRECVFTIFRPNGGY
jgi:hypothetical protein